MACAISWPWMRLLSTVAVAGVLALAGCDVVFDLHHDTPASFLADPDGDFDQDEVLNRDDKCPTLNDTEVFGAGVDTDEDGVGDACDPHPTQNGDCLILFEDFAEPELSPSWHSQGEEIFLEPPGNGEPAHLAFFAGPQTVIYLDFPLPLSTLRVDGYVQEGDGDGSPDRHAIEVFSDLQVGPTAVSGRACTVESQTTASQVTVVDVVDGVDTVAQQASIGSTNYVGSSFGFTLDWGNAPAACHGALETTDLTAEATLPAKVPAGKIFGLRGLEVGLHLHVITGYATGCPAPSP